MASTFQRMSNGRCLVNIVTGAEQAELARFGVTEDKETRYERTGEFIEVMRGAWSGKPFSYKGKYFEVTDATTREVPNPVPPIYFGGASASAEKVAGDNVDLYLSWGETPDAIKERQDRVAAIAAAHGRTMRFGIRFHTIARPTSEEAWAVADGILNSMAPDAIAAAREDFLKTQSVGQRRQFELHGGDLTKLEIHPNVWAGIGLVRGGVGTALVGSYEEVADRIVEYHNLGIEAFIMSGYPHLEEAYWFGEGVMPILRERGYLPALEGGPTKVFSFR
jgi:alkanesulfonate monooxygenase